MRDTATERAGPAVADTPRATERSDGYRGRGQLRLTAIALLLAALTGVYWQQARQASDGAGIDAAYPRSTGSVGVEEARARGRSASFAADEDPSPAPAGRQAPHAAPAGQVRTGAPPFHAAMKQARFSESLVALSPLRFYLEIGYQESGRWPDSFADIGLDQSALHDGKNIVSVELGGGGRILARLSDYFGPDARISLVAESIMAGTSTRWNCKTNVSLSRGFGEGCAYDADVALSD